jgi:hypothetical protein
MHTATQFENTRMLRMFALVACFAGVHVGVARTQAEQPRAATSVLQPKSLDESIIDGEAVVRIEPATVSVGEAFKLECEISCTGGATDVYNGFLSERYRLPAQIVITSADGTLRRELLRPSEDTPQRSDAAAWLLLRSSESIGRELVVQVTKQPSVRRQSGVFAVDLPAGEYYIQAIYNHWLIANWLNSPGSAPRPPADGSEDEPRPNVLLKSELDKPRAVSKPVKLVVTAESQGSVSPLVASACPLRFELRPAKSRVTVGRQAEIEVRMVNQSDKTIDVFNPLLHPWFFSHHSAVDLAILRFDETYLGNLLDLEFGSSRTPTKRSWVKMPQGGTISSKFRFRAGTIPQTDFRGDDLLPAGKYLLELRAREPILSSPPAILLHSNVSKEILPHPTFLEWQRTFPGPEISRSKRVELEILPRTGD